MKLIGTNHNDLFSLVVFIPLLTKMTTFSWWTSYQSDTTNLYQEQLHEYFYTVRMRESCHDRVMLQLHVAVTCYMSYHELHELHDTCHYYSLFL